MEVPALPKAYLALRVTWLCWLASLLGWFGVPAFMMYFYDVESWAPTFITEWSIRGHNAPICTALLLAVLAPTVVYRFDPRRRAPTFRSERGQCAPNDYRSPPALTTSVDARAFAANVRAFSWRLGGATSFCAVACYELWTPIFWVQTGCMVWPNTFCFTEYMAYLVALLGVVLVHAPTWRRVFGSPSPR